MKLKSLMAVGLTAVMGAQSANALNIVLTNDDSYASPNIQALYAGLTNAGHDVILSAPCLEQSGKGGSVNILQPVSVTTLGEDQACVGDTNVDAAKKDFVDGTPIMAAMYGIDVLAQKKWGQAPDLVISGPNHGHNLGSIVNISGTVGASNFAIGRDIPVVAVSADTYDQNPQLVAEIVLDIVAELEAKTPEGERLLPNFTGLSVNLPADLANHKGYAFTAVGWNTNGLDGIFVEDLGTDETAVSFVAYEIFTAGHAPDYNVAVQLAQAALAGKSGITLETTGQFDIDQNPLSEGNVIKDGFITISTIEGNNQAPFIKSTKTSFKLRGLNK